MARVDAYDGYGAAVETVYALEQCSVTAVADHNRIGGLFADTVAVELLFVECAARKACYVCGKFAVERIIETVTFNCGKEMLRLLRTFYVPLT